jgi:hypothetical protein
MFYDPVSRLASSLLVTHSFLIMPEAPTLLGRDIFAQRKTRVLIGHSPNLIMPLAETRISGQIEDGLAGHRELPWDKYILRLKQHILIRDSLPFIRRQGKVIKVIRRILSSFLIL